MGAGTASAYEIIPPSGPFAGGNTVAVTNTVPAIGSGGDVTQIEIGGISTTNIVGQGTNWVKCVAPAVGVTGAQDVVVHSTSIGATTLAGAYIVNPAGRIVGSTRSLQTNAVLAGGESHSLAVKSDGSVVGWGYSYRELTIPPLPNKDFLEVGAGEDFSIGLKSDGAIVVWGRWDETNTLPSSKDFVKIAAGHGHIVALKSDGSTATVFPYVTAPAVPPGPNAGFVAVAASVYYSMALRADGSVVAWANSEDVEPYVQNVIDGPVPNAGFVAIAAGAYHALGLKADGSIVVWGDDSSGQTQVPSPNADFVAIAAGAYHALGLKADGSIVAWGDNVWGQTDVPSPNEGFLAIAAGDLHSLALKGDGSIVTWGDNEYGKCAVPFPNTGFGFGFEPVVPSRGPVAGGYQVAINGVYLGDGLDITHVTLGGVSAEAILSQSATQVVVLAGAGLPGWGDVRIYSTSYGETVRGNGFRYFNAVNDYDGDGVSDLAVFHPPSGDWYIQRSADGSLWQQNWGWNKVTPVPGDYDGDRKTDLAVYHQQQGNWYIRKSSDGSLWQPNWGWGAAVPVPSDYDGDGVTDLAVFHPQTGDWYIRQSADGSLRYQNWGFRGVTPVPADYDGDNRSDVAVYDDASMIWYVQQSRDGSLWQWWQIAAGSGFGTPVPGDYDSDGRDDAAAYYQADGDWIIQLSSNAAEWRRPFGWWAAVAVPGDYDGDGCVDLTVYQQNRHHGAEGIWTLAPSGGGFWTQQWGWRETVPVFARP
ncbi:MAG: FG-GAP-like repeat-containing protein [bacterium]